MFHDNLDGVLKLVGVTHEKVVVVLGQVQVTAAVFVLFGGSGPLVRDLIAKFQKTKSILVVISNVTYSCLNKAREIVS